MGPLSMRWCTGKLSLNEWNLERVESEKCVSGWTSERMDVSIFFGSFTADFNFGVSQKVVISVKIYRFCVHYFKYLVFFRILLSFSASIEVSWRIDTRLLGSTNSCTTCVMISWSLPDLAATKCWWKNCQELDDFRSILFLDIFKNRSGSWGNWTPDLPYAKRTRYPCAKDPCLPCRVSCHYRYLY